MSLLNGMHAVRVHDYRASGSFFRKAGWALQGPGGHTHISSTQLHELLHAGKAMIEIDKDAWHGLLHGHEHQNNPVKEKLATLLEEHSKVQKEMREMYTKAEEAYQDKQAAKAAKYHRELVHRTLQLGRIEKDIVKMKRLVN